MNVEEKRSKEKEIMSLMIKIYCKGHKHKTDGFEYCPSCKELLNYALERTEKCYRMAEKTFCSKCPTPCYKAEYQEKIKVVMKYSGPRMLFHDPVLAFKHMFMLKNAKKIVQ